MTLTHEDRLKLAKRSLRGLALGDAFGQRFFGAEETVRARIKNRELPESPWKYTDDAVMAIGIAAELEANQRINQDSLAQRFADNYALNPNRGYGGMAHDVLTNIGRGHDWRSVASQVFEGSGSFGNGGAMRSAPIGAYFNDDLAHVAKEAELSAEVTHTHLEGKVGAIAIAVAAASVASRPELSADIFFEDVLSHIPESETKKGIERAIKIPAETEMAIVVSELGNGSRVSSMDTVPLVLWVCANYLNNLEEALWVTVSALGDRDTTCAMVGGILSLNKGAVMPPAEWWAAVESLDFKG